MPKIKINDIDMYYEIHGEGEPLILIAGFSVDHTVWLSVLDQLKEHFQVIVFDNRGSGQTDVPEGPYSIDMMADEVAMLCEKLKIKQAHFIGSSMGGFILQSLSYRYSDLVKSAVISNSTFIMDTCYSIFVDARLELIKAKASTAALIKATLCWVFSYTYLSKPGMLDTMIQLGLDNPYPFTIQGCESQSAALCEFDSREWLNKIDTPTLVIGSDQDLIFYEPTIKALADKISNAQYFCFEECGHVPHIEYPEKFIDVVAKFVHSTFSHHE